MDLLAELDVLAALVSGERTNARVLPHSFRSTPIKFIDGRLMVTDDWAAAAEAFPSCVEEKATKPVSPTNTVSWCSAMNLAIGCVNSPAKNY